MKTTDKFVLFYGGPFSQWYPHRMVVEGTSYSCAEQYMMAMKAFFFGDSETYDKIMATSKPWEQKALGRLVKGFDVAKWSSVSREYVYRANKAKFSDPRLKHILLETGDREIVEASPTDKIWGIGLDENDPAALDKKQWQGLNWLGECIMRVREELFKELMEEEGI
jgi:ribA/ribD-fused uncharacterized protein